MKNADIQSKIIVNDGSESAALALRPFFQKKKLIALRNTSSDILEILETNTDLGAVFLSEESYNSQFTGTELAHKIHSMRPELPVFVRKNKLEDSDVESVSICDYYSLNDLERLSQLLDEHLFTRYYPIPLIRGIQEISQEAFRSSLKDIDVVSDSPYLIKDNIIYGELFSMIPLESDWCRGYMMLQTTEKEVLDMIASGKTHLDSNCNNFRDVNSLLNEITNLIWGGIRARLLYTSEAQLPQVKTQVPTLINHVKKFISFGTTEPQLCFRHTVVDKNNICPNIILYQKLVFNLDWRPEDFQEPDQAVDDLMGSGELELF